MIKYRHLFVSLLLSACVINGDKYARPRDLNPESLVDRTRILAIQAEPPEVRPGDSAEIKALLADPNNEVENTLWVTCSKEESSDFGCAVDTSGVDFTSASPEELEEAGIIGFEPFLAPTYSAPPEALNDLDPEQRTEGTYALVQAFAFPNMDEQSEAFDFNSIESGFKRIVISEATTPNSNPSIERWTVDGVFVDTTAPVVVAAGASIELGIELSPDSIENYEYQNSEGIIEQRTEEPYARWYGTAGSVDEDITLYPYLTATVRTPDAPGTGGTWWAVVRDRRGGITWLSQNFIVKDD